MTNLVVHGSDTGLEIVGRGVSGPLVRSANGGTFEYNDPTMNETSPGVYEDTPGGQAARMANFNANGPAGGVSEQQLQQISQGQQPGLPPREVNSLHGGDLPPNHETFTGGGARRTPPGQERAYAMGGQAQPQYAGPPYRGPQSFQDNARAYGGYGGGYQQQQFQMMQPQFPQWNQNYGGYGSPFQFNNPYMGSVGSGMGGGYGGGASYGQPPAGGGGAQPGNNPQQATPQYSPPMLPNGINPNLIGMPGYNQYTAYGQQSPYQNPYQQQYRPPTYGSPYGGQGMGGGYPMASAPVNGSYPQRTPTQSHPYTGPPLAFGGVPAYQGTSGGGYGNNLYSGMASNPNLYGASNHGPGPGPSSGGSYNSAAMYPQSPFYTPPRPQNPSMGYGTAPPPSGSTGYTGSAGGLYGGMAGTGYR